MSVAAADPDVVGQARPGPFASWWRRVDPADLARIGFVGACALAVVVLAAVGSPAWLRVVVGVAGLVVGCWSIAAEAALDVWHRRMSMELSMLLAIAAAAAIGEWVTALVITAFVIAAEMLEDLSMDRGRTALSDLLAFLPQTVLVIRDGLPVETPLEEVRVADRVLIRPGGRVPVDGTVREGASDLDVSRITGEPVPVAVTAGDTVAAGSISLTGGLELTVERTGSNSSYGRIVAAVRAAQQSEAPVQRLADRLAGWLVLVALAAAALTWVITGDVRATISVVIVAGACGVAAGTPLALLAAIARAARAGAYVKDAAHLERLAHVDTVLFDKTGTLTVGAPSVQRILPEPGWTHDDLLAMAAAAERDSEHPFGQAIARTARRRGVRVPEPDAPPGYVPGRGVTARVGGRDVRVGTAWHAGVTGSEASKGGDESTGRADEATGEVAARRALPETPVHVAVDGRLAGTILLSDRVRPSVPDCGRRLEAMGLRTVMLTGDVEAVARDVAARVGIDDVRAGLLPTEKQAVISRERAAGRTVAMVGDGVNDASSLAAADVGISVATGTDIARESSDIVLVGSDLAGLASVVTTARRARGIILFNFIGTLVVDAFGVALASVGLLGPLAAAILHVGSESAFILNSARLIPGRQPRRTD